jgi:hypothetical protein
MIDEMKDEKTLKDIANIKYKYSVSYLGCLIIYDKTVKELAVI